MYIYILTHTGVYAHVHTDKHTYIYAYRFTYVYKQKTKKNINIDIKVPKLEPDDACKRSFTNSLNDTKWAAERASSCRVTVCRETFVNKTIFPTVLRYPKKSVISLSILCLSLCSLRMWICLKFEILCGVVGWGRSGDGTGLNSSRALGL